MKKEETTIESLRRLLIGATILSVEKPEACVEAGIAVITAQCGHKTTEFVICGNDLGDWVASEKVIDHDHVGRALYTDMRQVMDDMVDHALYMVKDCGDYTFEAMEDAKHLQFGFRCTTTQKEWWFTLRNVRASNWAEHFKTVEGRKALAIELGNGVIPGDFRFDEQKMKNIFGDIK